MAFIPITKDEDNQQAIPSVWRGTLAAIANALVRRDYSILRSVPNTKLLDESEILRIERNIEDYGERLIDLPETTWDTSICQWQLAYWNVLVDLFTEHGRSDLVMFVEVYEDSVAEGGYRFEIDSVHVP